MMEEFPLPVAPAVPICRPSMNSPAVFSDGDITGLEIGDGKICLIKWHYVDGIPTRSVLEEVGLTALRRKV